MGSIAGFDWDDGNRTKCTKHGVSLADIEAPLLSGDPALAPDLRHSDLEDRFIAVGRNDRGRPMFVAFLYRTKGGKRMIRPVSARYMHRKEALRYEKESS